MLYPNEIFSVTDRKATALTDVNRDVLSQIDAPSLEKVMVPTTDGKEMTTWVVLPNFDPAKKYPAILSCQGGPQQAVSQFWSYRWNLMLMASNGYIAIAPNRRGLPGFGTEWNAQIPGDYPGQNMQDYLSAVDYMKQRPYVDGDRIGAVRRKLRRLLRLHAGRHPRKPLCRPHQPTPASSTPKSQYLETGGNVVCQLGFSEEHSGKRTMPLPSAPSPTRLISSSTAGTLLSLVTHGEYDYRILSSQGEMASNAARLRGVPAEMVIFPDENHWILKPQNAILWQRVFFRWLDRWLKPGSAEAADSSFPPPKKAM